MDRLQCCRRSYNPGRCHRQPRFGLLRVRSPLLAQSLLLSFPPGTKMFQFPGFALGLAKCRNRFRRVSPFGHPRVAGYLPLTAAFRSLSRPSSPPRATGIPHAPFFSFLSLFKRLALRMSPGRGAAARPRLLDLGRCRSISLSTRFLASISRFAGRLWGGASRSLLFAFPTCQ